MLTKDWTIDQKKKLLDEYVLFRIEEMTRDEMASYVYDSMRQEIIASKPDLTLDETLKQEIDEYDEYLYEKLTDYVLDKPDSYSTLCEFLRDRQDNIYYDN